MTSPVRLAIGNGIDQSFYLLALLSSACMPERRFLEQRVASCERSAAQTVP